MRTELLALRSLALLLASITLIPIASAATWPEKPVRVIIPWPPGGSTDIVGRLLAAELTTRLNMNTELFKLKAGVNMVHVPFKGTGDRRCHRRQHVAHHHVADSRSGWR